MADDDLWDHGIGLLSKWWDPLTMRKVVGQRLLKMGPTYYIDILICRVTDCVNTVGTRDARIGRLEDGGLYFFPTWSVMYGELGQRQTNLHSF